MSVRIPILSKCGAMYVYYRLGISTTFFEINEINSTLSVYIAIV